MLGEIQDLAQAITVGPTIPEQVRSLIADLIVAGNLKPGDRLVERRLARELKMGQPTIREALKMLENEGLVTRRQNVGCFVTTLSPKEYDQIFRLRLLLEPFAAELAVENREKLDVRPVLVASGKLKACAERHDAQAYYRSDLEFHKTMWSLSSDAFLTKMLNQITVPLFAFQMIKVISDSNFNLSLNAEIHERIAQAIVSQEKQAAREIVGDAIRTFWKIGRDSITRSSNR